MLNNTTTGFFGQWTFDGSHTGNPLADFLLGDVEEVWATQLTAFSNPTNPGAPVDVHYRANVIGSPHRGVGIHTAAFAVIPAGQFGNGARTIVYSDGITDWDVSLFKDSQAYHFQETRRLPRFSFGSSPLTCSILPNSTVTSRPSGRPASEGPTPPPIPVKLRSGCNLYSEAYL